MYKIAELNVNITPVYKKITTLLQPYKSIAGSIPDVTIPLTDNYYRKKQNENPHLSLEQCENIWSSSVFSSEIINFNGIVLHSSAILYAGGAYLFSADSGVGKSTHTALWQKEFGSENIKIINDDKPAIRIVGKDIFVYGTPWCGESYLNTNVKAPLKGIVFLEQDSINSIHRLTNSAEIISRLYKQTMHRFSRDKVNKLLDTLEKIIANTNFYILKCNISSQAVYTAKSAFDRELKK